MRERDTVEWEMDSLAHLSSAAVALRRMDGAKGIA